VILIGVVTTISKHATFYYPDVLIDRYRRDPGFVQGTKNGDRHRIAVTSKLLQNYFNIYILRVNQTACSELTLP